VPHDGHHRGAWFEVLRLVLDVEFDFLDRGVDRAAAESRLRDAGGVIRRAIGEAPPPVRER